MQELIDKIIEEHAAMAVDLGKSAENKSAARRARKKTLELAKLYKEFRKVSV